MRESKLKMKLIFAASLFMVAVIVLLNIRMSVRFVNFSRLLIEEKLTSNVNSLAARLDESKNNSRTAAVSLAQKPRLINAVRERDRDGIIRLLDAARELYRVNYVTVTDHEGVVIARTHEPENYGDAIAKQRNISDALAGGVSTYFEPGTVVKVSARTGAPIYDDDGTLLGALSAGVRFDTDETVRELQRQLTTEVTVYFGGTRVASTIDGAEGTTLAPHVAETVLKEQREFSGEVVLFDRRYETFYKPLVNADGEAFAIIFLGIPIDHLTREANALLFESILVGLLGITISLILLRSLRRAMAASLAKSGFLANMSHEIRTPMNAVIGMAVIGKNAADAGEKNRCFEKISGASKHLLGIISDILDMSKIEADKFELSAEEFVFEEMLQRSLDVVNHRAGEKRQKVSAHVDAKIPKTLIGDDLRLSQVITNIAGNAVKFTPEFGRVDVSAKFLGEEGGLCVIQIEVRDTGIGMTPDQQAGLFRPFQQAESGTTRKFGGTGLGLAISKNIVGMMGGKIWAESEPGKGSTFAFTIKARRGGSDRDDKNRYDNGNNNSNDDDKISTASSDTSSGTPPAANIAGIFKNYRALLVEDVEINREIAAALLEPTQIKLDCAENGEEAVKLFSGSPDKYDIIFMDVQMPEMDGYEATRRIRALDVPHAKTVPIVAMTANVFKDDIEYGREAGMNDHIGKPIDEETLVEMIKKYLCIVDG